MYICNRVVVLKTENTSKENYYLLMVICLLEQERGDWGERKKGVRAEKEEREEIQGNNKQDPGVCTHIHF
jgi:hypothetical protein